MSAVIVSGKDLAVEKRAFIKEKVSELHMEKSIQPCLAVILVGQDPASQSYVRAKQKACEEAGIKSILEEYPSSITQEELLNRITHFNDDASVHGILVQLPLPDHIDELAVIEHISPNKDVDGFHPVNIGRMMIDQKSFLPCTPYGIVEMIKSLDVSISGKHVVVIGRSNIVGKPVGQLLLKEDATVTYCHSRTKDLASITKQADILIAAVGRAKIIGPEYVKDGAIVIDVGVNRLETGKLCGDVDFESVKEKASFITPVPGGVGPMTITMLLHNTLQSAQNQASENKTFSS
ncbi:bifunctional methylenetetrahydrofolate dehydrogenase/methenyltetrahydrofolate cyclohydrolase FolD [Sutcliffiella horikoshii]|uniref:Bifunctional protein FolD n=1 Tax=Sutcliffiella horikoshii TaxID=79883 RepID=A0A1Y0CPH9_9BACI|nr:bifunctional methylenetetrahydrofolate dehydrogenase/methenyltetrahydrofolate cyclohydrolase FolD [Sutcliffiella horikoshii]ART77122.1 bifunctional methylenetetrahydrofolate dehydrogenase/methenyltetrahydrofolate cyclohydrolase [Sutcliffiella horikoshii]TYS57552.1 bifunctional methylenetetrahydrofolate dehydrogenase/methenyltetrahydrofolate cyclohydrolase FolD [Sutcliffiella horikoshii]